jgi:hypothetical protein
MVKILSIWNKERILKATRQKQQVTYKGQSIGIRRFLNKNSKSNENLEQYIPSPKRK